MPTCLESLRLLGQATDRLPLLRGEWGQEWVDALSTPVSLIILGAGFLGLLVGFLVGKGAETKGEPSAADERDTPGGAELRWRHEKLVLLERQQAEKQTRLEEFVESVGGDVSGGTAAVKVRLFALAEILREERQQTGSDHSRLSLVDERLGEIEKSGASRPEAIAGCREIARKQIEQLEARRDALRSAGRLVFGWEDDLKASPDLNAERRRELRSALAEVRRLAQDSSVNWHAATGEADRQISDILAAGGESVFDPIRTILLVDGSETDSLASRENRFPDAVAALEEALDSGDRAGSAKAKKTENQDAVEAMRPDESFLSPVPTGADTGNSKPPANGNGNGFHDLTKSEAPEDALAEPESSMVIFRANDAELWGRDVYRGTNSRARALSDLPEWARWISIERLDTGERVFAPIGSVSLSSGDPGFPFGFNGTNELFYGARHLGVFAETCPNDVETRFTYGGWGFGHRVNDADPGSERLQASGWEGREIDADTVFEISLHAELPELGETDRVLEAG
ncbi:MAG: hypothetical protein WD342_14830 [Verrucomicrobiales bacterium]